MKSMAKELPRDSQILLNMLKLQRDMQAIFEDFDEYEEVAEDRKSFDLLYFYAIKMINLTKGLHNKTKKESLEFFDDFKNKMLLADLAVCYPTVSKTDLVKYFYKLCDESSISDVLARYEYCISTSKNYNGDTKK